ncbi:hypothetical protein TIFTF001_024390 [Ficus carica]|uniref:Homeobox domain-containing protein n=1 Tax=Ficus carica TaxID=3494 RepID=A0AA88DEN9_FICCA|nr:hypothetical protein TIFTF001_024390 [Ficus carica]
MGSNEEFVACKLGLGVGEQYYAVARTKDDHDHRKKNKKPLVSLSLDLGSFELCHNDHTDHAIPFEGSSSLKTKNELHDDQEVNFGNCRRKKNNNDIVINDIGTARRKKLKLTKEQTTFLEGCFKFNTNLYPAEKQELAEQLNLNPRQVEVWFQNRRARMKMKQTEEDCKLLRKYCESLGQENKRLRKELQELRSMTVEPYRELHDIQFPNTTNPTICLYCKKMSKLGTNFTNS